jgi:hypothetical protein
MNDIRMEGLFATMYNIRRATFIIKTLGKEYYPESILVQKMEMVHRERVSHNLIIKPTRTWWQDNLIKEVAAMTTSTYVDVRKYI